MFDLKVINSVLDQLEEERGIPREKMLEAIEAALATAYKKEYGKRTQIIRARFNLADGSTIFEQAKVTVAPENIVETEEEYAEKTAGRESLSPDELAKLPEIVFFDPEKHILLDDAKRIKKGVQPGEELVFPLENKGDYGRIAAQTAKQVIIQKMREAEKVSVLGEFGGKQGEIVSGTVQRIERGNIFVDMGRATAVLPYDEQIPGERYRQGERIRAFLFKVEETPRGIFLRLSRSHPQLITELFKMEAPEVASGAVELKAIAREAGSRTKVAVASNDSHIDPIGSMVGQRGVRVSTVMSELGGEKIDIIEWSADSKKFIEDALSPAKVLSVTTDDVEHKATVEVSPDQQSLAIGKGGQNVRLAAKLTGWKIDIKSAGMPQVAPVSTESAPIATPAENLRAATDALKERLAE